MKNYPLVSIVVPCFNNRKVIEDRLKNFLKTTYPNFEIIVVDDASTDGTFEFLEKKFGAHPKVRIVHNRENLGPAGTRNHGARAARGKYLALLETDMEVEPRWLEPMVQAMEEDKKLGGVQSKILDFEERDLIQAIGAYFIPHTFWVVINGFSRPKKEISESEELGIGVAGSLIRASLFKKIGGQDEKVVYAHADIEISWAIWLTGFKTLTIPESITYHVTGKPCKKREGVNTRRFEFHFHKTPRMFLKLYQAKNIVRYLPALLAIFILRIFINLLRGDAIPLYGFIKANLWNIRILPDTLRERRRIQKLRKVPDSFIMDKIFIKESLFSIYRRKLRPVLNAFRYSDKSLRLLSQSQKAPV